MDNANTAKIDYSQKYDVFISYRRDGGEAMAILLHDRLTAKGYKVFLDIENLNSGTFNTKLFDVIDGCKDFLLVCSIGSLDRCVNEGDWVRMEIDRALRNGKNIIPVMLRGFEFPEVLPEEIEQVRMQNGVNANTHEYFDAAIDRLADKFLQSEPIVSLTEMSEKLHELINQSVSKKPSKRKIKKAFSTAVLCIAIAVSVLFYTGFFDKKAEITICNNTPDTIQSVSIKQSATNDWGANIAEGKPLLPNETLVIKISKKYTGLETAWDMRSIFYFGDEVKTFTLEGFLLYNINDIIIYTDEKGEYQREFLGK